MAIDTTQATSYRFAGGFPTRETAERAHDQADLNRAIQAYRFFYPSVSGLAIYNGNIDAGIVPNQKFGVLDTKPRHKILTANSDTPYGSILLDLRAGPMVIELPPGPLIVIAMDVHQRWIGDMGIPGPEEGNGAKHLILPPAYDGQIPAGYRFERSLSNRVMVGVRSLPVGGDVRAALDRIKTISVYPVDQPAPASPTAWPDLTDVSFDSTPLRQERTLAFWEALHEVLATEPAVREFAGEYGELAALGITRDGPFAPDARMRSILEEAARIANAEMRVTSFADRRSDRVVWPDRTWEWAALRFENGDFRLPDYLDIEAREKWFYQAIGASPAMFRRAAGAGSLYWLGLRDSSGEYLDGGKTYTLRVPLPVPAGLFWSVTVYDAETRCEIDTEQGKAALRSLFELKDKPASGQSELTFGPAVPAGKEDRWIRTIPGKGWFAYFRIYGPEAPAFDGSWKPDDFLRAA